MPGNYGRASVKVSPDLTNFRRELKAELEAIDTKLTVEVALNLDKGAATAQLDAWRAQQSRKSIKQEVDVDSKKTEEALLGISNKILGMAGAAGRAALTLTAMVGAANEIATIAPVLVSASGALLLIPAAAGVAASALGAVKLGADGIKAAFKQLTPTMDTLKKAVSDSFEQSLNPAVDHLRKVLPQLTTGFKENATAIGGIATNMAAWLDSKAGISAVKTILDESSRTIQNLGKAIVPVVAGLINIGAIGAPILRQLTAGAGQAGQKFLEWTQSAAGIQQIKGWIQGGVNAFRDLWTIGGRVVDIVKQIVNAFQGSGVGVGGIFGSATLELDKFLHTAEGQGALKELAQTIGTIADTVRTVLAAAFKQLGPIIQAAAPFIRELVTELGSKLVGAINTVGPIIRSLFQFLSDHKWAAQLATELVSIAAALKLIGAASKLANSGLSLLPGKLKSASSSAGGSAGNSFGSGFVSTATSVIKGVAIPLAIVDVIGQLGVNDWFNKMSGGAVPDIWHAIWQGLFGVPSRGGAGLVPWILEAGQMIGNGIMDATGGVFRADSNKFKNMLKQPITDAIATTFTVGGVVSPIRSAGDKALSFWQGAMSGIATATSGLQFSIGPAMQAGFAPVAGIVSSTGLTMTNAWAAGVAGLQGVTYSGIGNMEASVAGGVGAMAASVASGGVLMQNSIGSAMAGMAGVTNGGIGSMVASVSGGIGAVVGSISGGMNRAVGSVVGSMGVITGNVGSAMGFVAGQGAAGGNGFANGLIGSAGRAVGGMAGIAAGIRGAASVNLEPVGSAIAQGLANGINARAGAAVAAAASMASRVGAAAAAAAGVHSPSKMMFDQGIWYGPGLALGITENADQAVAAATAMTNDVLNAASGLGSMASQTYQAAVASTSATQVAYKVSGDSLEDKVATALSGWTVQQDAQGTFRLNRKVAAKNATGR